MDEAPEPQLLRRFDSLTSQTLSKRISRELLTTILRGEIPPGNALPSEEDLAATGNHLLIRLIDMIGPVLRFGWMISLERRADGPVDSQRGHRRVLEAV